MRPILKNAAIVCTVAVLSSVLGFAGYGLYKSVSALPEPQPSADAALSVQPQTAFASEAGEVVPVLAGDSNTLDAGARIIYRYHYLKDGHMDVSFEEAPYFLVGLTRTELAERMTGWDLVEFRPGLAVFEKKLNARSTEQYTVGILDGYVAVFYDQEVNGSRVKEVTQVPVDALSVDELSRLEAGIRVIGEEQLVKVLEDYGS